MQEVIPWYEKNKERYRRELNDLENIEISYKIDEDDLIQNVLRIKLEIKAENPHFDFQDAKDIKLVVIYPDNFPYFRPQVYAYDLDLPRHQNIFDKNLCLLQRTTEHWEPEMSLASLLQSQLPKLLIKGYETNAETLRKDRYEQAEPASAYYVDRQEAVIFNVGSLKIPENQDKELILLGTFLAGYPSGSEFPTRLAVLKVFDKSRDLKYESPESVTKIFPNQINGVIFSLLERPPSHDARENFRLISEKLNNSERKFLKNNDKTLKNNSKIGRVIALTFPEEIAPGERGNGWIFIISGSNSIRHNGRRIVQESFYHVPVAKIDKESMTVRIPKLKGLENKRIAIIGLGSLGAPSAIEFARCGIAELKLIDHDYVEPATTVRWPLGVSAGGLQKTTAISNFIHENYPETKILYKNLNIGSIPIKGNEPVPTNYINEKNNINEIFNDTSMIFESTGEVGLMHFLSKEAKQRGIPFVSIYSTPGAFGGLIVRVVPKKTEGCWMCLRYKMDRGEFPVPKMDLNGEIQPPGCGDITFTGTNFDLQNITIAGVRLAISTLCSSDKEGYPDFDWDVGVLTLFDDKNNPIAPLWVTTKLTIHPECPYCNEL